VIERRLPVYLGGPSTPVSDIGKKIFYCIQSISKYTAIAISFSFTISSNNTVSYLKVAKEAPKLILKE
jgi:hypothetical protein